MGKLVRPKVFMVGYTTVDQVGLRAYLEYTGNQEFMASWDAAKAEGLSDGECLCSLYAKLCYRSLTLGKNANVSRVRDIRANIESTHDTGHGSVWEHFGINFVVTDCSRVYTHEQVRHRSGWAYSQTSGRYCRLDQIDLVWSDLLDPVKELWLKHLGATEDLVYLTECKLGLRKPNPKNPSAPPEAGLLSEANLEASAWDRAEAVSLVVAGVRWVPDDTFNFDKRKAITSAIRRIAPNGQANEIGMTCNIRALRQVVQTRTARFAETEIRDIYAQVYHLVSARFPTIFHKAKTRIVDGLPEVYNMRLQPYEIEAGDPKALEFWGAEALRAELAKRDAPPATAG